MFYFIYLTFSQEFEFVTCYDQFFFLGILSNGRLGRIKEVIAIKYWMISLFFPMKVVFVCAVFELWLWLSGNWHNFSSHNISSVTAAWKLLRVSNAWCSKIRLQGREISHMNECLSLHSFIWLTNCRQEKSPCATEISRRVEFTVKARKKDKEDDLKLIMYLEQIMYFSFFDVHPF